MTDTAARLRGYSPLYLATPYTLYPGGLIEAYSETSKIVGRLMAQGVYAYSPIVYTHPLAHALGINPLDQDLWMKYDDAMMSVCQALIVGRLPGWETSRGVLLERKYFAEQDRPIFDINPQTLEIVQ